MQNSQPVPTNIVIDGLRSFTDREATYARTSTDGIKLLEQCRDNNTEIDELWFDHDLGGDDTIRPVVRWLLQQAIDGNGSKVKRIHVHTSNPVGGQSLVQQLQGHYEVDRVDALSVGLTVSE